MLPLLLGPSQPPECQRLKGQEETAGIAFPNLFIYRLGN